MHCCKQNEFDGNGLVIYLICQQKHTIATNDTPQNLYKKWAMLVKQIV
jgi:hypothetical protein